MLQNQPFARREHRNEPVEVLCSASDNDAIDEFNADRLWGTLDLFILKRLSDDGPLSLFELQRRAKPIHTLLELFAVCKGKQTLVAGGDAATEPKPDEGPESELVYSLTVISRPEKASRPQLVVSLQGPFVKRGFQIADYPDTITKDSRAVDLPR